jgi:hypothetical protein
MPPFEVAVRETDAHHEGSQKNNWSAFDGTREPQKEKAF